MQSAQCICDGDARAGHALDSLRRYIPPTHGDKEAIYAELQAWLREADTDALGEELMDLRSELQTDLDLGTKTH